MTNQKVRDRLADFYADAGAPATTLKPAKTPAAIKQAAATNTRRRLALHAGPELVTVSQLAKELGLEASTIKKRAVRMGCAKLGRAFYFTKAQADAVRADPPKARKRVKSEK